jgi:HPt (histidine-containing phosphotransfer) domain-containing protein
MVKYLTLNAIFNGIAMSNNSIDLTTLNELKEIMADDFAELITVFISDSQIQLDDLTTAIAVLDAQDIKRIAHTLKGSSANLGIENLSGMCKKLELNAAQNNLSDANDLLKMISNEYNDVKIVLEKLI